MLVRGRALSGDKPLSDDAPPFVDDTPPSPKLLGKVKYLWLEELPREQAIRRLAEVIGIPVRFSDAIPQLQRQMYLVPQTMHDVLVEEALLDVCQSFGGQPPLAYDVINGVLVIMTEAELAAGACTAIYDLRDLTREDFVRHRRIVEGLDTKPADLGELWSDGGYVSQWVISRVLPSSWIEYGGRVGNLLVLPRRLVIEQSLENHRRIRALLAEVRGTRNRAGSAIE